MFIEFNFEGYVPSENPIPTAQELIELMEQALESDVFDMED